MNLGSMLFIAVGATVAAVLAVFFSRRWRDRAKDYLRRMFGEGPNDDDIAEDARCDAVQIWMAIATVAWLVVAVLYHQR